MTRWAVEGKVEGRGQENGLTLGDRRKEEWRGWGGGGLWNDNDTVGRRKEEVGGKQGNGTWGEDGK